VKLEGIYVVVPLGNNRFEVKKERQTIGLRLPAELRVLAAIGRRAKHSATGVYWSEITASCRRIGNGGYLKDQLAKLAQQGLIEQQYSPAELTVSWRLTEQGLHTLAFKLG